MTQHGEKTLQTRPVPQGASILCTSLVLTFLLSYDLKAWRSAAR